MTVRCGHKTHDTAVAAIHHHETVELVRICFTLEHGAYSIEEMAGIEAEPQTCSICDAPGHGYPGGGSCPLEVDEVQAAETDAEERMAALFAAAPSALFTGN